MEFIKSLCYIEPKERHLLLTDVFQELTPRVEIPKQGKRP